MKREPSEGPRGGSRGEPGPGARGSKGGRPPRALPAWASASEPKLSFRDRLNLYRPELAAVLEERGEAAYRYGQLYDHTMRRSGVPWRSSTALPAELRARLEELGESTLSQMRREDDDEGTTKLALRAADGFVIESVIMRYAHDATVCVSSQIGCALGCTFCATGAMGFKRNLRTAEIVDQVRAAQALLKREDRRASHVVFMGMGEPLLNLPAVLDALKLLHDPDGLGFARRSLSVSTIGIPSGIRRLAEQEPQVHLAVSLHAPDDELRRKLMPAARRYPLDTVLAACEDHFRLTRRKLFVEYLLLRGVNDSPRQAGQLAQLLKRRVVTVNLIPWNPTCEGYLPPDEEAVKLFRDTLRDRGLEATVRDSRGWSIAAACGQLAGQNERRRSGRSAGARQAPSGSASRPGGGQESRRVSNAGKSRSTEKKRRRRD